MTGLEFSVDDLSFFTPCPSSYLADCASIISYLLFSPRISFTVRFLGFACCNYFFWSHTSALISLLNSFCDGCRPPKCLCFLIPASWKRKFILQCFYLYPLFCSIFPPLHLHLPCPRLTPLLWLGAWPSPYGSS